MPYGAARILGNYPITAQRGDQVGVPTEFYIGISSRRALVHRIRTE
jgi:hypothetical protein